MALGLFGRKCGLCGNRTSPLKRTYVKDDLPQPRVPLLQRLPLHVRPLLGLPARLARRLRVPGALYCAYRIKR